MGEYCWADNTCNAGAKPGGAGAGAGAGAGTGTGTGTGTGAGAGGGGSGAGTEVNKLPSTLQAKLSDGSPDHDDRSKGIWKVVDDWITDGTTRKDVETTYGLIENWDTSEVISMAYLFYQKDTFNADLSKWNTDEVNNMAYSTFQFPLFNSLSTTCFLFLPPSLALFEFLIYIFYGLRSQKMYKELIHSSHFTFVLLSLSLFLSLEPLQCFIQLKSSTRMFRNGTSTKSITWNGVRFNSLSSTPSPVQPLFPFFFFYFYRLFFFYSFHLHFSPNGIN